MSIQHLVFGVNKGKYKMKYDNNQYYYSPSKNYPFFLVDNKPDDSVEMTVEMEGQYEDGVKRGLVIQPNKTKTGFVMVDPDTLLTTEELTERNKQRQLTIAQSQLDKSIRLESGVYQRKMTATQKNDFVAWQDDLFKFINDENVSMPEQPNFIKELLTL